MRRFELKKDRVRCLCLFVRGTIATITIISMIREKNILHFYYAIAIADLISKF